MYDKAESCSITAVTFTKTNELVSSNMRGQLKTWDLRSNSQSSVRTCSQVIMLPKDLFRIFILQYFSQKNIFQYK